MEASWHKNRREINMICEKRIFEKSWLSLKKNHYFDGSGIPSWEPKPINNRLKFEGQDGMPLGIDF